MRGTAHNKQTLQRNAELLFYWSEFLTYFIHVFHTRCPSEITWPSSLVKRIRYYLHSFWGGFPPQVIALGSEGILLELIHLFFFHYGRVNIFKPVEITLVRIVCVLLTRIGAHFMVHGLVGFGKANFSY